MTQIQFLLLLFVTVISFTTNRAQDRAPHGLAHENPMAFSPSAYDFFHPKVVPPSIQDPCDGSNCAPFPIAATVQSSLAQESRSRYEKNGSKVGAGGIAGVIFGFVFVVLLAMGTYYVVITRRTNSRRKNTVLPSA
ncbi:uncharacterized protein LOC112520497 [Cynara cardunculus var. scolymus]|uniref:Transmembrane protein n=1 Tax=Cynara cardunculus var. scolymus TaxID=59895 RepID=A0A103Y0J5_CYNCS|nr:uncharacterized protein LOC112520497 [Cynara cardunculus var. scolymus]KVI00216.1 hypothetical protein Ccrd_021553 [Cynara cardunculus var. scolymus]